MVFNVQVGKFERGSFEFNEHIYPRQDLLGWHSYVVIRAEQLDRSVVLVFYPTIWLTLASLILFCRSDSEKWLELESLTELSYLSLWWFIVTTTPISHVALLSSGFFTTLNTTHCFLWFETGMKVEPPGVSMSMTLCTKVFICSTLRF